jgi:hypothetical protein
VTLEPTVDDRISHVAEALGLPMSLVVAMTEAERGEQLALRDDDPGVAEALRITALRRGPDRTTVAVDPWLAEYLRGETALSAAVESFTVPLPALGGPWAEHLADLFRAQSVLVEILAPEASLAPCHVAGAARLLGLNAVALQIEDVDDATVAEELLSALYLQCRLLGVVVVLLSDASGHRSRRVLSAMKAMQWPTVIVATTATRTYTPREPFATLRMPAAQASERAAAWRELLPPALTAHAEQLSMLPLGLGGMYEAWMRAASAPDGATGEALLQHARDVLLTRSSGLASIRLPRQSRADLVLPEDVAASIADFTAACRNHAALEPERQQGVRALFSGPSGTGKTAIAETLGDELGLPVLFVDVSRIVDKYIGETEKNLNTVLDEAERSSAVLVFDEGESLFGSRTMAGGTGEGANNRQVSYLLARLEQHRGTVILITNYPGGIDFAFLRRFHFHVAFKAPLAEQRAELWRRTLARYGVDAPVDVTALAPLELSAGSIANACYLASLLAPSASAESMESVLRKLLRNEYARLKKPVPAQLA